MSQNGQAHFKNLLQHLSDHFGPICIKGLNAGAVTRKCFMKKVFLETCKVHRKTPVPYLF